MVSEQSFFGAASMADGFSDSSISPTIEEIDEAALLELSKRMDRLEEDQAELEVKLSRIVSGTSKVLADLKEVLLALGPQSTPIRSMEESPSKVIAHPAILHADDGTIAENEKATDIQPMEMSLMLENAFVDASNGLDLVANDCVDVVFAELEENESDDNQSADGEVVEIAAHELFDEIPVNQDDVHHKENVLFGEEETPNYVAHNLFDEMTCCADVEFAFIKDESDRSLGDYLVNDEETYGRLVVEKLCVQAINIFDPGGVWSIDIANYVDSLDRLPKFEFCSFAFKVLVFKSGEGNLHQSKISSNFTNTWDQPKEEREDSLLCKCFELAAELKKIIFELHAQESLHSHLKEDVKGEVQDKEGIHMGKLDDGKIVHKGVFQVSSSLVFHMTKVEDAEKMLEVTDGVDSQLAGEILWQPDSVIKLSKGIYYSLLESKNYVNLPLPDCVVEVELYAQFQRLHTRGCNGLSNTVVSFDPGGINIVLTLSTTMPDYAWPSYSAFFERNGEITEVNSPPCFHEMGQHMAYSPFWSAHAFSAILVGFELGSTNLLIVGSLELAALALLCTLLLSKVCSAMYLDIYQGRISKLADVVDAHGNGSLYYEELAAALLSPTDREDAGLLHNALHSTGADKCGYNPLLLTKVQFLFYGSKEYG